MVIPPTSSDRSPPPVPMAWEIPRPALCMRVVTSCRPVPEAETRPIVPSRMTLPKPSTLWLIIEVPQSGPIRSNPFSFALLFSSSSSSRETLLLKRKTLRPLARACIASLFANWPGTEMTARLASGKTCNASSRDAGALFSPAGLSPGESRLSTSVKAAPSDFASLASMATTMSSPAARPIAAPANPASDSTRRFSSVPMTTAA